MSSIPGSSSLMECNNLLDNMLEMLLYLYFHISQFEASSCHIIHLQHVVSHQVSLPDVYRGKHQDPDTAGPLYALEIRDVLEKQDNGVGAFIHESMLSCAGQIIPPKNYLKDTYK